MKKVFAIIAIMVVLVGAVFAETATNPAPSTGAATLKVVTLVSTFEPYFKLVSYSTGTTVASDSGNLQSDTTAAPSVGIMAPATTTDGSPTDKYHVIDANTLIDSEAQHTTVSFAVIQTRASKSYKTYTLSATSTPLTMVKKYNNVGALVELGPDDPIPSTTNHRVFAAENATVDNFAAGSAISAANELTSSGAGTSTFSVTYGGALVAADVQIATFSCSWTNDSQGVPGQYEADVILTVTSN